MKRNRFSCKLLNIYPHITLYHSSSSTYSFFLYDLTGHEFITNIEFTSNLRSKEAKSIKNGNNYDLSFMPQTISRKVCHPYPCQMRHSIKLYQLKRLIPYPCHPYPCWIPLLVSNFSNYKKLREQVWERGKHDSPDFRKENDGTAHGYQLRGRRKEKEKNKRTKMIQKS